MSKIKAFLRRKDIVFSGKRYGIDALGAMAQGLFCTLLVGTILNTIGKVCIALIRLWQTNARSIYCREQLKEVFLISIICH